MCRLWYLKHSATTHFIYGTNWMKKWIFFKIIYIGPKCKCHWVLICMHAFMHSCSWSTFIKKWNGCIILSKQSSRSLQQWLSSKHNSLGEDHVGIKIRAITQGMESGWAALPRINAECDRSNHTLNKNKVNNLVGINGANN